MDAPKAIRSGFTRTFIYTAERKSFFRDGFVFDLKNGEKHSYYSAYVYKNASFYKI